MDNRGGVPPIVTVLIIVSFLISSALVGWFIVSTAIVSTKQALVSVSGSPTITLGSPNTLYLTLRNDGTRDASIDEIILSDGSSTYSCSISSSRLIRAGGSSLAVTCTFDGSISSGKTLDGVVRTDAGEINFRATVIGG
ncbi:MAG: hypothetical protein J7K23_04285 [Thermoproteales archaeon]|nr:hypothetical protein [Thermoproteales archaeon]